MSPENPNEQVTRADLEKQLEVHAKTIELQILLSQQQDKILEKLDGNASSWKELKRIVEEINKRTWKQTWLFWGLIGLLVTSFVGAIVSKFV
jgi:hypothetical protein